MQGKLTGKDWNKHFTKEDTWMAVRHMEKYLASLIIWGVQSAITETYHKTAVEEADSTASERGATTTVIH